MMDAPLSLTRPKRAAASATVVKIGQSLREQDSTITEARTYPSALPVVTKRAKHVWACEQGRQRNRGSGVCEHGRKRSKCNECGGTKGSTKRSCPHGRRQYHCKECGGKGICEHGRQRGRCKECGGAQICEHGRERYTCKECGGKGICEHGRERSYCKECRGGAATVDEGWDVLSEDALAVELFPEDALFAEVDWEDVGWDW